MVVKTQIYPTDLNDSQWNIIQPLIPLAKSGGRPRELEMRLVVNALLYIVVGGIQCGCYPKNIRNGKAFTITFVAGVTMAPGNDS